jgi:hypothetical protein
MRLGQRGDDGAGERRHHCGRSTCPVTGGGRPLFGGGGFLYRVPHRDYFLVRETGSIVTSSAQSRGAIPVHVRATDKARLDSPVVFYPPEVNRRPGRLLLAFCSYFGRVCGGDGVGLR